MYVGDGIRLGGLPLSIDQDLRVGGGGIPVLGPLKAEKYALALFSTPDGRSLLSGPAPGQRNRVLLDQGEDNTPAYGLLPVASIKPEGASNYPLLSGGTDASPSYRPLPISSLEGSGTTGQILTSQGSSTPPLFTTLTLGAWIQLSHTPIDANLPVTSLEIAQHINTTYNTYVIVGTNIVPQDSGNRYLYACFQSEGTWVDTTGALSTIPRRYLQAIANNTANTTSHLADRVNYKLSSDDTIVGNSGPDHCCIVLQLFTPATTAHRTQFLYNVVASVTSTSGGTSTTKTSVLSGGGSFHLDSPTTGVKFGFNTGRMARGTFTLYGIKYTVVSP